MCRISLAMVLSFLLRSLWKFSRYNFPWPKPLASEGEYTPGSLPLLLQYSLELQDLVFAVFQLLRVVTYSAGNTCEKGVELFLEKTST